MTHRELSHKLLLPLMALLLLSLMLAISNLLIQQATAAENYNVTILNFSFNPQVLCIEKGDTVVWTNKDPVIYTLWFVFAENQSTCLLSDPILPGQSWSHTFTKPVKLLHHSFERLWVSGEIRIFTIFGDVNGDSTVKVTDLFTLGKAYGTSPSMPNWNPNCDFNGDNTIEFSDLSKQGENYGKTDP